MLPTPKIGFLTQEWHEFVQQNGNNVLQNIFMPVDAIFNSLKHFHGDGNVLNNLRKNQRYSYVILDSKKIIHLFN